MLKGTRQWACCRLGSQNARWRAISTAHNPLYPGYGNGTWKLTLLMIGRAPDSRSGPVYRDPASPRQIPYCYTNCRRDSRGYASHGSAPVRSAAGSTRVATNYERRTTNDEIRTKTYTLRTYTYYIHLLHTLITYTYYIHLLHTLIAYPYYIHLLHTLFAYTYYIHLLHTLITCTYYIHLLHTLIT